MLAIALFCALIYSNIFEAPFFFDDVIQIEDKAKIRDIGNYFSPKIVGLKRPFVELTFAANYKLGKLNSFGYHLVNVFIHIINGILAYFLAATIFKRLHCPNAAEDDTSARKCLQIEAETSKLKGEERKLTINFQSTIDNRQSSIFLISLFAALVFVAHPIQTQAVTYTVQRYTSLAAMFYMASVFLYTKGRLRQQGREGTGQRAESGEQREEGRRQASEDGGQKSEDGGQGLKGNRAFSVRAYAYFAFSFICGILAFLSKENAASLPAAILLVEFFLFDRTWRGWKRKLIWLLPAFVSLGVFILYVSGAFRGDFDFGSLLEDISAFSKETGRISRWNYLCTQFNVIVIYVRLLFFPFGQNVDYMYPFKSGFFDGLTPLAFLFVAAIVLMGVWNLKKRPIITFGIFWFLITLSVESSIIPIKDALFEHRLYLPIFGFALLVAYLICCLLPVKRFWRGIIAAVVIVGLGCAAYVRNEVYRDRVTLWSDVVSKSPENYRAHFNLGNALRDQGRMDDAIHSYAKALTIKPNFAVAHDNLGVVLMENGKIEDAIAHFVKALETRPRDAMVHCNLGTALMRKGKLEDAIRHLSKALQKKPTLVEARNNLGIAYAQQGNLKEAIQHFSEALRAEPENHEIHKNLGFALMLQGDIDGSILHFSEAIRIKPDYAEAHDLLGRSLTRLGDYDRAISHFYRALEIQPELKTARQGLQNAVILNKRKRFE
jgi:tetratricopeptide (TPR) repeat protein